MIVGIAGRTATGTAGAGKTTVANMLTNYLDADRYSFAGPLYAMVKEGFGIDGRDAYWKERKKEQIDWLPNGISPRYLYETLGTEWGRQYVCEDLWIRLANRFVEQSNRDYVIIDDVRFENETTWIRSTGGKIVHIERPDYVKNDATPGHKSNELLPIEDGDLSLLNIGSMSILIEQVRILSLEIKNFNRGKINAR